MKSISWSKTEDIIDRDSETEEIIDDIKQNTTNKVHILFSKTARGKSSLVAKVYDKYDGVKYDTIRIKSVPNNSTDENAWEFLELIFHGILDYYTKEDEFDYCAFTFEHYLSEFKDPEINELRISSVTNEIVNANGKKGLFKGLLHTAAKKEGSIIFFVGLPPLNISYSYATLDRMEKQCCSLITDGEELKNNLLFPRRAKQCSIVFPSPQGQVPSGWLVYTSGSAA